MSAYWHVQRKQESPAPVAAGLILDFAFGWGAVFAIAGLVGIALSLPLLPLARRA